MARSNTGSTSNWLSAASSPIATNGLAHSISCWFRPAATTATMNLVSMFLGGGDYSTLAYDGANEYGTDNAIICESADSSNYANATSTAAAAVADTWYHAGAVFTSATSRAAFLNGANKGTNATSVALNSGDWNATSIAGFRIGSTTFGPFNGRIAEVGIWNVALTDAEMASLGKGASPLQIRPSALVFYAPLMGRTSPEVDLIGARHLTINGTMAQAEHVPIKKPSRPQQAFAGAGGTQYTLDVEAGSFAITGTAATFDRTYIVDAAAGSYAVTGTAASLEREYQVNADSGTYAISGTDATFDRTYILTAESGTYAYSGTDATFDRTYILAADGGSYAITGTDVSLQKGVTLDAGAGSFAVSGADATFDRTYVVEAGAGSYAVTGTAASLEREYQVDAGAGSYAVTGTAATFDRTYIVEAGAGSYAVSGTDATFDRAYIVEAGAGSYSISGTDAALVYDSANPLIDADPGSFVVSGTDANLEHDHILGADAGSYAISGTDATLIVEFELLAGGGVYVVSGTAVDMVATGQPEGNLRAGWVDVGLDKRRRLRGLEHIYKAVAAAKNASITKTEKAAPAVEVIEEFLEAPAEQDFTQVHIAIQRLADLKIANAKRALAEIENIIEIERDEDEAVTLLLLS